MAHVLVTVSHLPPVAPHHHTEARTDPMMAIPVPMASFAPAPALVPERAVGPRRAVGG